MSEHRQLELDIRPTGRNTSVKVDGASFHVDRLHIYSGPDAPTTTVETRFLKHDGMPYRIVGRLQPEYIGPVVPFLSLYGAVTSGKHEPVNIDITLPGLPIANVVKINGEDFPCHSVEVFAKREQMTHVILHYQNYEGRAYLLSGRMLPEGD